MADYVFKADDDIVVNPKVLVKITLEHLSGIQLNKESHLNEQSELNKVSVTSFGCHKFTDLPVRSPESKYFIPKQLWSTKYPSYYSGAAYMMTIDVALKLAEVKETTTVFPIDDVYIGVRSLSSQIKRI